MKKNHVAIELDGPYWSGGYVAELHAVQSLLTDHSHRQLVALACVYWPEIAQHVEARKQLRRYPAFVLAVMLRQL
jgi:hypothetical protein